mmetsp:Transcript_1804/g.2979  ORF Transcript_1804/g.2979 Transcript_1804/m.2979 type:complete len:284 (-) Transcript_1804:80-931(-)
MPHLGAHTHEEVTDSNLGSGHERTLILGRSTIPISSVLLLLVMLVAVLVVVQGSKLRLLVLVVSAVGLHLHGPVALPARIHLLPAHVKPLYFVVLLRVYVCALLRKLDKTKARKPPPLPDGARHDIDAALQRAVLVPRGAHPARTEAHLVAAVVPLVLIIPRAVVVHFQATYDPRSLSLRRQGGKIRRRRRTTTLDTVPARQDHSKGWSLILNCLVCLRRHVALLFPKSMRLGSSNRILYSLVEVCAGGVLCLCVAGLLSSRRGGLPHTSTRPLALRRRVASK